MTREDFGGVQLPMHAEADLAAAAAQPTGPDCEPKRADLETCS